MSAVVKISKNFFIPEREIKYYCSYDASNAIKRDVTSKRKEGLVVDVTSGKRIVSVVYTRTGEVILSNTSIETLHSRISNSIGEVG